mgnify:CR=1 FL=1
MNMDKVQHFLNGIVQNEALAHKLREAASREEVLGIAEAHGYELSEDDLRILGRLARVHDRGQAEEELSDDELLMITGGTEAEFLDWSLLNPIKLAEEVGFAASYYLKNL